MAICKNIIESDLHFPPHVTDKNVRDLIGNLLQRFVPLFLYNARQGMIVRAVCTAMRCSGTGAARTGQGTS